MNQICRDIFRAIHEGKWLKIEYRNKADQITKYWIGIRDLDPAKRTLKVDGLHLGMYTLGNMTKFSWIPSCPRKSLKERTVRKTGS